MVKISFEFSSRTPAVERMVSDRLFWEILERLENDTPTIDASLEEVEKWQMERVMKNSTTVQEAGDRLGVSRRNVYYKQEKHGIEWDRPNQRVTA